MPFPFTDLTAAKLRPALVIYEDEKDAVLAFISSKIPSEPSEADVLITKNHSGFRNTGLKVDSIIKLDKIATVLKDLIVGEIGPQNGYMVYECPNCKERKYVPFTCKSRLCSSCGTKAANEWADKVHHRLLKVPHRHVVFTLPDKLL